MTKRRPNMVVRVVEMLDPEDIRILCETGEVEVAREIVRYWMEFVKDYTKVLDTLLPNPYGGPLTPGDVKRIKVHLNKVHRIIAKAEKQTL